jgi:hypothetical protein
MPDRDSSSLENINNWINVTLLLLLAIDIILIRDLCFIPGSIFLFVALSKPKSSRVPPVYFPVMIEDWVVWEYTIVINTKGLLGIDRLHDLIKKEVKKQCVPLNIFYAEDVCWIVHDPQSAPKIDTNFRCRAIAELWNSPYENTHFVTGLDNFGGNWANLHMMIITRPERVKNIPKPRRRDRFLDITNLIIVKIIVLIFTLEIYLYQAGAYILIIIIAITTLILYWQFKNIEGKSRSLSLYKRSEIEKYEKELKEIDREEKIDKKYLPRSFEWDDLRVFHEVMNRLVTQIINDTIEDSEVTLAEGKEFNPTKAIIPRSKKDLFE